MPGSMGGGERCTVSKGEKEDVRSGSGTTGAEPGTTAEALTSDGGHCLAHEHQCECGAAPG
jgi:hypothetical protein